MKKIIFLDIDGVLATNKEFMTNRTKFRKKYPEMDELKVPYAWNKDAVKVFNEILDVTGAEIILSSDWKLHWDLDDLKKIFEWNGVKKHPIAVTNNEYTSISNLTMNRAAEIEDYVRDNDIKNYVVIDDLNVGKYMGLTGDDDKFFMTISGEGIKKTGLKDRIIKKLNNDQ